MLVILFLKGCVPVYYDRLTPEPVSNPDRDYFIDRDWTIENYSMMVKHRE